MFYNALHYKEGLQINVFEKKMSYYLFTNIYSSVTTSQYLFMDGLVDCYEIILFILMQCRQPGLVTHSHHFGFHVHLSVILPLDEMSHHLTQIR